MTVAGITFHRQLDGLSSMKLWRSDTKRLKMHLYEDAGGMFQLMLGTSNWSQTYGTASKDKLEELIVSGLERYKAEKEEHDAEFDSLWKLAKSD